MLELLTAYSVKEILIFIVTLAFAAKGCIDLIEYFKGRYEKRFNKDYNAKTREQTLEEHYVKSKEQHEESLKYYQSVDRKIDTLAKDLNARLTGIEQTVEMLKISNIHDIKGWIVEKHHRLMKRGWVDDFTMDTLEKRFTDYKNEGGNSYIEGLMKELRALPHTNPEGED